MYVRRTPSGTHTFIVSGMLWRNSLVMNDLETGSDWSHITGACIRGPLEGEALEVVPSVQTTWREWRRSHPETKLLRKDRDVRSSRYAEYFADPERTGLFRTEWLREQLPGKALVHGISRGPHALAVTEKALAREGRIERELGRERVEIVRAPDGGVRAYVLAAGGAEEGDGARREEIPVGRYFWFAWSSFYPNTAILR